MRHAAADGDMILLVRMKFGVSQIWFDKLEGLVLSVTTQQSYAAGCSCPRLQHTPKLIKTKEENLREG